MNNEKMELRIRESLGIGYIGVKYPESKSEVAAKEVATALIVSLLLLGSLIIFGSFQ